MRHRRVVDRGCQSLALLAQDLLAWLRALVLSGELQLAKPKRLRQRLLHVAGRITRSGRRRTLRLPRAWPWAEELLAGLRPTTGTRRAGLSDASSPRYPDLPQPSGVSLLTVRPPEAFEHALAPRPQPSPSATATHPAPKLRNPA